MLRIAGYLSVAVLGTAFAFPLAPVDTVLTVAAPGARADSSATPLATKGDRLPLAHAPAAVRSQLPAAFEMAGETGTTVVLKSADGRELFRNDPGKQVTVVAKDVVIPAVTFDQPEPHPTASNPPAAPETGATEPVACESVASPLTAPHLRNTIGRCLAGLDRGTHYALAEVPIVDARTAR